uniref:Uncharacterized protein n=1 Tax=Romanomermis culicivorax TaxID=13658 RepID=A0A915J7V1_ROMCU
MKILELFNRKMQLLEISDEKIVNFSSKTGESNNDYSKLDDGTTTIIIASSPEMAKNIENEVSEISSRRQTSSPIVEKMHLFSSKSLKNGHSRTKFSSNILQNAHFQPTMKVKSFEDEYLEKENAKKLAQNGEILSSKFVVCPKNGAFDGASQLEMGDLDVEYQKLQDLFQEWKILSDANDQNNNNLTTSQMLNFQRLQTKVLEQHEFVQNLYEKQEKQEKPCLQKTLQSISQNLNFTPGKSSICKATVNNKCKAPDFSENEDLMSAIRRFGGKWKICLKVYYSK